MVKLTHVTGADQVMTMMMVYQKGVRHVVVIGQIVQVVVLCMTTKHIKYKAELLLRHYCLFKFFENLLDIAVSVGVL